MNRPKVEKTKMRLAPRSFSPFATSRTLSPEEILYCGDSEPDVAFAANAGFRLAAAAWGYRSRDITRSADEIPVATPEMIEALKKH